MHPFPGVTRKSAYHHGDLRAQLIAAVRDLVETQGAEGFSVAEAARRVGVSSAAPYKHFKDRPEILRGVVSEAMDRLRAMMETAASAYPPGSFEAVAAVGQAYLDFARGGPGVFRLAFGQTEGRENAPDMMEKCDSCFEVVVRAAAGCLGLPPGDPEVLRCAYMLWSFVHGHAFLTVDMTHKVVCADIDDWAYLLAVSRAILGRPVLS
jgi:AcrR family transcriptional regulator